MNAPTPTPAPAPASASASTDRLGTPVTPAEAEILRIYGDLKRLCERGDLPPCAARNARKALACIHVAANDLDLVYEHLYDLGV